MIFEKFKEVVQKYGMLSGGETVVAGVSGGVDSTVLLHLLHCFMKAYGGSLVISHLNHGLRGQEADRDEAFVRSVAGKYGLPFKTRKVKLKDIAREKGLNLQDAGRKERYRFFADVIKEVKGDKIAVGHNADDQAETVMMRVIRGTGMKGLGGVPPARGNIIRPLIDFDRQEIESYAQKEKIEYIEDSSNRDRKYMRNRIRHELIPQLKSFNPNICRELGMLSSIARDVDSYLDDLARCALTNVRCENNGKRKGIFLNRASFLSLPSSVKSKVIFHVLEELSGEGMGFFSTHILDVESLVGRGVSGASLNLPKRIKAVIEYENVHFYYHGRVSDDISFSRPLNLSGITSLSAAGIELKAEKVACCDEMGSKDAVFIDMDKVSHPLEVRNLINGDRLILKGMRGRKKLKDFFIDEKIPREMRTSIPLLISGGEILWVVGLRHCGNALADSESTNILKISRL
ncbi:MAG: tRNA lysidine(34) synthetase TilS [Proteobacteria bacterium]|nr:tRNA lysidine(34) synthetase TilS [Pseudomonadota bacterium]